jgi:hypothetical protein
MHGEFVATLYTFTYTALECCLLSVMQKKGEKIDSSVNVHLRALV